SQGGGPRRQLDRASGHRGDLGRAALDPLRLRIMSTDRDPPELDLDERQLAEFRRELMQLPARKRLEALLEPKDAGALVRALPASDLYPTIHDLGLADATDLVQLASPEQFQVMVDLAAWK